MRKIGTFEDNYHVYINDKKKIIITFETENHTISITNVKWFDENSEETLNFVADLIIDDKFIGKCSNSGRGGNADYYLNDRECYQLANKVEEEVGKYNNYCVPRVKMNFRDMLDALANFNVMFIENKVKTIKHSIELINAIQKRSDQYRKQFENL